MFPYNLAFTSFAVITLALTLYFTLLTKLKCAPSHPKEVKLLAFMEKTTKNKPLKERPRKRKTPRDKLVEPPTEKDTEEKDCPHYIGYLTTLPKGTAFPDECFGCRKVIQCLRIEPAGIIESFYMTPTEAQ